MANKPLEWHEPTVEEFAAWYWDMQRSKDQPTWAALPANNRAAYVDSWRDSWCAAIEATGWTASARILLVLARAIEFERRCDIYLANAEAALDSIEVNRGKWRKLVEERDKALGLHEQAWSRVNALVAKVLGKEVGNGIDVG